MVARAFAEVKEEHRDPYKVRSEFSTTVKTTVRDVLQEHSGHILTDKISRLAGRCAVCGPFAAVAGYGMEHFLINNKIGDYDHVKQRLEGERGILQPADLCSHKRPLTHSRSECTLHTASNIGAASSTG